MANGKQKLEQLLEGGAGIQKGAPYTISADAESAPAASETAALQRGAPFTVSTADDAEVPLPEAVLALRVELQEIARSYIGARRRSGKALLEAARWLSEARAAAQHGEWDNFLAATETTADTAERLRRIYDLAMQHSAYAAAVAEGRLNQSTAERLARDSTPPEVIDVVLTAQRPPTVADVNRAIREARASAPKSSGGGREKGQIPQIAEFEASEPGDAQAVVLLGKIASLLSDLANQASNVPNSPDTLQALDEIERAVATIRASLDAR